MAFVWEKIMFVDHNFEDIGAVVADKRTDKWLLVYSPVQMGTIVTMYLVMVWAGPRLMRHREPVDLRKFLILYNMAMVGLSVYMFHEFLTTSWLSNYSLLCQPVDFSDRPLPMRMAQVCWWFYLSKIIELSDTLFFILRKKNNQLTFLHVFHHTTMVLNWRFVVKYTAGGQSFFMGLLNTFVHSVMYAYYGLAAIGPHMQKYLWWKSYLTLLQLFQLVLVFIHTSHNLLIRCDFPTISNLVMLGHTSIFIVLFINFYYRSYLDKRKQK
nr:elongation of very long chain fatty acids protein 4-like [Nerophis lumbriciformis]